MIKLGECRREQSNIDILAGTRCSRRFFVVRCMYAGENDIMINGYDNSSKDGRIGEG